MTYRDARVAIAGEDDLTLLGHLEPRADAARRLGQDRAVDRSAAPPEGTATTVEERQPDVVALRPVGERGLGVVQQERCGQRPDVLRRVGVAEHALAPAVVSSETLRGAGQGEPLVQNVDATPEVLTGLEQRPHA